ncbi:DNA methyltransferase [Ligilactobacillus salivarius]|uniref:DNA methyltransferase n=1 Tax=Ligilactobacillus salivarius TaxID=1624 RepID=UPI003F1EE020
MAVESKVIEHIRNVLETFDDKYILDGRIKKTKVIEDLDRYDHDLIKALLSDDLIHNSYTEKIADVEVFKVNQFIEMLEFKKYWEDSYTKYSNKIGLTAGGKFIDESTDVVLDFPFKDTVLKAGMSKEDLENSNDADEPFLNEVIAKPEIDELFEPKVLVNARRYDNSNRGGYETSSISDDDNLVIKGNNLIALYSLKKRYAGKVKLIYLDPPYNTGSDSFGYNDKFNHSAWLTFMKNRLEIAREMLSDDGMIFIQTDDNEHAYLRVLMDEIFGVNRYLNTITIKAKASSGASGGGEDKRLKKNTEFILLYANDNAQINIQQKPYPLQKYIDERRDLGKNFAYTNVLVNPGKLTKIGETVDGRRNKIELFDVTGAVSKSVKKIMKEENLTEEEVYFKYLDKVYTTENAQTSIRTRVRDAVTDNGYTIARYIPISGKNKGKLTDVGFIGPTKRLVSFLKETTYKEDGVVYKTEKAGTLWEDISWSSIKSEGSVELDNGKKPEKLLQRIIASATDENDIVLDFFGGSGSTAATAHKMNRKYITIEQMDYVREKIVKRLNNVIEGDTTGISKDVNWQGGGSFVYAELMEKNQGYLKDLQKSESIQELMEVYNRMKENADIDFRLDLEKFEEEINTFSSLDKRRKELIRILDKNQLYYNYANIDDENVKDLISDTDYKFNKSFYSN